LIKRKVRLRQARHIPAVAVADSDRDADKPGIDLKDLGRIPILPCRYLNHAGKDQNAKEN